MPETLTLRTKILKYIERSNRHALKNDQAREE